MEECEGERGTKKNRKVHVVVVVVVELMSKCLRLVESEGRW